MSSYKIIEIMIDIAFKYRCTESFDIDENICTLIKEFRTDDNQQWRKIQSRLIRVCCEIGTFNELKIFNNTNTPQYFKKSIETMMSGRSKTYKNTAISFDDIVTDDTYFIEEEDNEDKDRCSEMQVFAMIKALEDDCLPSDLINCSLMSKFNFFRKRYFESRIHNGYLLSIIERFKDEEERCKEEVDVKRKEERCKEEVDDDNDYDNDGDDTNLDNDDDDGTGFFCQ